MGAMAGGLSPETEIRPAVPSDLEAIHRIAIQALGPDAWSLEGLQEEMAQPHARVTVVEKQGGGLVAYALAWLVADEATLVQVGTLPGWRRQGIALRLLQHLLAGLRADGAVTCHLEVRRSRTAARALYERLGFAVQGVRKDYYRSPREDAWLMALHLAALR